MQSITKTELLDVLSYDRFNETELTWADRIFIHRFKNGLDSVMSYKRYARIVIISNRIKAEGWTTPEYRYNGARLIEVYDEQREMWRLHKRCEKQNTK